MSPRYLHGHNPPQERRPASEFFKRDRARFMPQIIPPETVIAEALDLLQRLQERKDHENQQRADA